MVSLDLIWNLKIVCLLAGPALLFVWFLVMKVNSGGIFDRANITPTLVLAPSGIISILVAGYMIFFIPPLRCDVFVVNHAYITGRLELAGKSFEIAPGDWQEINFRNEAKRFSARGYLGDSLVFDTVMTEGSFLSLLSGNRYLRAEEWVYSQYLDDFDLTQLFSGILETPGILRFSEDTDEKVYAFEEEPPSTIKVDRASSEIHAFELSMFDNSEQIREERELDKEIEAQNDVLQHEVPGENGTETPSSAPTEEE
jgi:hypothetical protein